MLHCDLDNSVPEWIIEYPRTYAVFQSLGIDCSCGGKSLQYRCEELGLNPETVLKKPQLCISRWFEWCDSIRGEDVLGEAIRPLLSVQ